jgi:predicted transcriptional regulator
VDSNYRIRREEMYSNEPWTLDEKKVKKSKSVKKSKGNSKFFKEDIAVAAARVMELFEKNKSKIYTIKDIELKLGLSNSTASDVVNRLEAIGNIKCVRALKRVSAYSLKYQHKDGPLIKVEVDKGKEDPAEVVKVLFEDNKNKVFNKKSISATFPSIPKSKIDVSLRILLLNKNIKIVNVNEKKQAEYQHISGNRNGVVPLRELPKEYITLKTFLKDNGILNKEGYFEKELRQKGCLLFYSEKGIVPVYKQADLIKILNKSNSIIKKIFGV